MVTTFAFLDPFYSLLTFSRKSFCMPLPQCSFVSEHGLSSTFSLIPLLLFVFLARLFIPSSIAMNLKIPLDKLSNSVALRNFQIRDVGICAIAKFKWFQMAS